MSVLKEASDAAVEAGMAYDMTHGLWTSPMWNREEWLKARQDAFRGALLPFRSVTFAEAVTGALGALKAGER